MFGQLSQPFSERVLSVGLATEPNSIAVCDERGQYTWSEVAQLVAQVEDVLNHEQLPRTSRVLLVGPDSVWHLAVLLASANTGRIFAPINAKSSTIELAQAIELIRPSLCLVPPERSDDVQQWGARPTEVRLGPLMVHRFESADVKTSQVRTTRTPFLLTLTSGSTGRPKRVLYSIEGEYATSLMHASLFRFSRSDVVLPAPPLSWVYGLTTVSLSALLAGARVVIPPRFSPRLLVDMAAREAVTAFFGVTTHYRMLLNTFGDQVTRLLGPHLRLAVSGGEARDENLFERAERVLGVPVLDLYCSSEARPGFGYDPLLEPRPRPGSCGRLVGGVQARTSSDGTLSLRSRGSFMGYFDPDLLVEREVGVDDWVPLGDIVALDDEGWGYVRGRTDDLIIRGGANVSPVEVEEVLLKHPQVAVCKVMGIPSATYGQEVAAVVAFRGRGESAPSEEDLIAWCASRLANYKVPARIVVVDELPVTVNQKIDRRAVLRLFG